MLAKTEGKRRRVRQRMTWLGSITNSMDMKLSKLQETMKDRHVVVHGVAKSWARLSDRITITVFKSSNITKGKPDELFQMESN